MLPSAARVPGDAALPADRRLLIGAATNWAAFAAQLVVSFITAPYLIGKLGDVGYGVWCVTEGIAAYFTLFDLGIAAFLVRHVARYQATGERDEVNRIVSAGVAVFAAAGAGVLLVGGAVTVLAGPRLDRQLGGPGEVPAFLLLMVVNVALTLPLSVFPSVLDGLQRYAAKSGLRLAVLGLRVGGVIWVMETRPGLLPLAAVVTAANLCEHVLQGVLAFRFLPGLRLSRGLVDRATLGRVLGYSKDAFLAMLAGRVTVQTGVIVAGGFLGAAAAGHYANAARLIEMAKNLLRSVTMTLTPAVSEREARGDWAGVRRVFVDGTRWVLYVVLPVHIGIIYFGHQFLWRWLHELARADAAYPAAVLLSLTLTVGVAQSVAARVLYGLGRLRLFARLALAEAGLNLALSFALVRPWGLDGVAFAVAVPNVLFCVVIIGYAARVLGVGVGEYLRAVWVRPLLAAAVPAAVWGLLPAAGPTWAGMAVGVAAGLVPYGLVVAVVEFGGRFWRAGCVRALIPGGTDVPACIPHQEAPAPRSPAEDRPCASPA